MKKRLLFFLCAILLSLGMFAQTVIHNNYITRNYSMADVYSSWKAGNATSVNANGYAPNTASQEDENFFISRVKMMKRFVNTATQVNTSLNPKRKVLYWMPVGGDGWTSLPRYMFNSDVFSTWSYLDIHGCWTNGVLNMPGAFSDISHKNGVANACVSQPAYAANLTTDGNGAIYAAWCNGGAAKLLGLLRYYGIDGIGFNSECNFSVTVSGVTLYSGLQSLFAQMQSLKASYGWDQLHIDWYDGVLNNGTLSFSEQLNSGNVNWFHNGTNPVCNGFFLNYNWTTSGMQTSVTTANNKAADSSWDVYCGMDWQGRFSGGSGGGNGGTGIGFDKIANYNLSIGLWGAHNKSMLFETATGNGSSGDSVNVLYQRKLEHVFTGSTKNPVNTPAATATYNYSGSPANPFCGISKMVPAKSVLSWTENGYFPFVTYFNVGNGKFLNKQGETTFNAEWYNIGVQDYMPTWRWWITTTFMGRNASGVPSGFYAKITWEDAWFGGSCLKFFANKSVSAAYVQLFKTQMLVNANSKLTIRYKVLKGTAGLAWACSTESAPNTELSKTIDNNLTASDNWVEKTINIRNVNTAWKALYNQTLAVIGLKFTNVSSDFEILIGEISLLKDGTIETPNAPTITLAKVEQTTYAGVDFKLVYKMADQTDPKIPVYNSDVKTSFFEIWSQQNGSDPVLCTYTTSWAAYVIKAPYDVMSANNSIRFGVRAVGLDGKTEGEITWSGYQTIEAADITPVDDVSIDKPVIKVNEDFTLYFEDPTHAAALKWEIIEAKSGTVVKTFTDSKSVTTSFPNTGIYDLQVTYADNSVKYFTSKIQISVDAVGAVPKLFSFDIDESTPPTSIDTEGMHFDHLTNVKYVYTGGRAADNVAGTSADGTVSKAVKILEKTPIAIDGKFLPYDKPLTIAFWAKIDDISTSDKFNFMALRTRNNTTATCTGCWAFGDYGAMWSVLKKDGIIRVAWRGSTSSGTTFEAGERVTESTLSAQVGAWAHIAVTFTAGGNGTTGRKATFYFNGRPSSSDKSSLSASNIIDKGQDGFKSHRFYIGGTANDSRAGLSATIDDLQIWHKALSQDEILDAMNGYTHRLTSIPTELVGYWNFEEVNADNTFSNLGSGVINSTYTGSSPSTYGTRTLVPYAAMVYEGDSQKWTSGGAAVTSVNGVYPNDVIYPPTIVAGNPVLPGTFPVETTPTWKLEGATAGTRGGNATSGSATVQYETDGKYTAILSLGNSWGTDNDTIQYIVIDDWTVGLKTISDENIYSTVFPNPFIDAVNMQFQKGGTYAFDLYDLNGKLVMSESQKVQDKELIRMSLKVAKGAYVLKIRNSDNQVIKTVKLEKQ